MHKMHHKNECQEVPSEAYLPSITIYMKIHLLLLNRNIPAWIKLIENDAPQGIPYASSDIKNHPLVLVTPINWYLSQLNV